MAFTSQRDQISAQLRTEFEEQHAIEGDIHYKRMILEALRSAGISSRTELKRVLDRLQTTGEVPVSEAEFWLSGADQLAAYPTLPSISSSIRRFISTAYSRGSKRTIGSMKPFTIIALASSSGIPRLMR